MPFKKRLNKYLKNIIYKCSLANRPAKNNYYHQQNIMPYR